MISLQGYGVAKTIIIQLSWCLGSVHASRDTDEFAITTCMDLCGWLHGSLDSLDA